MLPLNLLDFRHTRKPTIHDARKTKQLERKQTLRQTQACRTTLSVICSRERDVIAVNRVAQDKVLRLGRAVLNFHAHTKKEEQKCIERLAKKRLKALKS